MNWARLVLDLGPDEAAWELADALEAAGAAGVSLLPIEDRAARFEPEPGTTPVAGALRLEALFDSRARAEKAAAALGVQTRCRYEPLADRDWVAEGRRGFEPRRFGRRLWVVPQWCAPPEPDGLNVVVAPGLAFGTGMHPTTALCLEWLARADLDGKTVIDYGCGSGVLAVAAARLGAARVAAVDNDPQALEATRDNARRNAVTLEVCAPDALGVHEADIVLANILARALIGLAGELCARVRAGGRIVLAGITASQADGVAAAYVSAARLAARQTRADWVCLELERNVPPGT